MKTITLTEAIQVDGKPVTQVTLRRPKVRDIKAAKKLATNNDDIESLLIANLCNLPIDAIDQMDLADYTKLTAEFLDFLPEAMLGRIAASLPKS